MSEIPETSDFSVLPRTRTHIKMMLDIIYNAAEDKDAVEKEISKIFEYCDWEWHDHFCRNPENVIGSYAFSINRATEVNEIYNMIYFKYFRPSP